MKLWASNFHKALDKQADDFNSSISFDSRMYKQDINGSIAVSYTHLDVYKRQLQRLLASMKSVVTANLPECSREYRFH